MDHPRLPKDKIPYWDFDAPNIPREDRDASAGAIMASAYVELSSYVPGKLGEEFLAIGEQQIRSLASPAYRAKKWGIIIILLYSIVLVLWQRIMKLMHLLLMQIIISLKL